MVFFFGRKKPQHVWRLRIVHVHVLVISLTLPHSARIPGLPGKLAPINPATSDHPLANPSPASQHHHTPSARPIANAMFLQRSAVAAARRAAMSPALRRGFTTTFIRRTSSSPCPVRVSSPRRVLTILSQAKLHPRRPQTNL